MSLATDYAEKRDFIRMRVESPITLTMDNRTLQCLCINLSGTGMCIETSEVLQIGDEALAFVPSYQNKFAPVNAYVRIKRVMQDGEINIYGAEIIELLA